MPITPRRGDGCRETLVAERALTFLKGRLIIARHYNLKFELVSLSGAILNGYQIVAEPEPPPSKRTSNKNKNIRGGISERDLRFGNEIVIAGVLVPCETCETNTKRNAEKQIETMQALKKKKYLGRCKEHRMTFVLCAAAANMTIGSES